MDDPRLPWLILCAAGGFSFLGGLYDWDFFMNSYRARVFVRLFGRPGARVFYMVLGGLIVLVSAVCMLRGVRLG